jgi:hypothetical protein
LHGTLRYQAFASAVKHIDPDIVRDKHMKVTEAEDIQEEESYRHDEEIMASSRNNGGEITATDEVIDGRWQM